MKTWPLHVPRRSRCPRCPHRSSPWRPPTYYQTAGRPQIVYPPNVHARGSPLDAAGPHDTRSHVHTARPPSRIPCEPTQPASSTLFPPGTREHQLKAPSEPRQQKPARHTIDPSRSNPHSHSLAAKHSAAATPLPTSRHRVAITPAASAPTVASLGEPAGGHAAHGERVSNTRGHLAAVCRVRKRRRGPDQGVSLRTVRSPRWHSM